MLDRTDTPALARPRLRGRSVLLVALIAFSLRPALTSVGPLLAELTRDFGLSPLAAALLTTLPVLCLGGFGALAAAVARRFGMERSIVGLLLLLAAALVWRAGFGAAALFAGTVAAGAAIGMGNVLLPAVLKRDFDARAPLMTGVYSTALCLGATLAAGAAVPLRRLLGDSAAASLMVWALPAALAAMMATTVWWPALRRPCRVPGLALVLPRPAAELWRSPLAWQVTGFMGLQSMLAYSLFGWLAPILRARGDDPATAGLVVSVSVLAQAAASLPAPILAGRLRQQSGLNALAIALVVGGFSAMISGPLAWQWAAAVATGLGMGAAFALAIMLVVLRAADGAVAARLSGMAQGIGYLLAAGGPLLIGLAHDRSGDFSGAQALVLIAGAGAALCGFLAGRARTLRG